MKTIVKSSFGLLDSQQPWPSPSTPWARKTPRTTGRLTALRHTPMHPTFRPRQPRWRQSNHSRDRQVELCDRRRRSSQPRRRQYQRERSGRRTESDVHLLGGH